jgi:hypothetical protein
MQAFNFDPTLTVVQQNDLIDTDYSEDMISFIIMASRKSEFSNDDRVYHYSLVYEFKCKTC